MVRSVLDGFATLEASGAFQLAADIDDSFAWTIRFLDRGLRSAAAISTSEPAVAHWTAPSSRGRHLQPCRKPAAVHHRRTREQGGPGPVFDDCDHHLR